MLRLEKRQPLSVGKRLALPFVAIGISFIFSFLLILLTGENPFTAFGYMMRGAFGSDRRLIETLIKTTPLILTGLSAAVAFKAKFYNLGGEGQLYLGALVATLLGITLTLPPVIHIVVILAAGALAGGLWALLAGILKAKLKVDEVVVTLLSNYIIIYIVSALLDGPLRNPVTHYPNSPTIAETAKLPKLLSFSRLHAGVFVGLAAIVIVWFIMKKTTFGFEITAVGANPQAAHFTGIPVTRTIVLTALLSGGLAGLAGVNEVCGIHYQLVETISPGYGYSGVIIAMLGALDPIGVALAAFLLGAIMTGSQTMSQFTNVPAALAEVIQGIILLAMLAVLVLTNYRIRWKR